jgi:hypothetical protein
VAGEAGFHTVNYSEANSAPPRGARRRVSQRELSHGRELAGQGSKGAQQALPGPGPAPPRPSLPRPPATCAGI